MGVLTKLKFSCLAFWLLSFRSGFSLSSDPPDISNETYEYIVVGSGPGGGPLAVNLAKAGHSVLLLEAGSDHSDSLVQQIPFFHLYASEDPSMAWDIFVTHYDDIEEQMKDSKFTWKTPKGEYHVGPNPPKGSTAMGILYPRTGTLGGCSTHNALNVALPSNSDWRNIQDITGDDSWSPETMQKYWERLERNLHLPHGTPGHGFSGYMPVDIPDPNLLSNRPYEVPVIKSTISQFQTDPEKWDQLVYGDLNKPGTEKDYKEGFWPHVFHKTVDGKRWSAATYVREALDAKWADGRKKYPLTLKLDTLVTKVLFDDTDNSSKPRAKGVSFLTGKKLYSASKGYDKSTPGVPGTAYATREVIIAAGTFNTPQLLKLSGIGPRDELTEHKIPVVMDLPGVGANLQDNIEVSIHAESSEMLRLDERYQCTFDISPDSDDPCFALWKNGEGPYTYTGNYAATMFKSSVAALGERDLFIFGGPIDWRGYFPGYSKAAYGNDKAWTWAMSKMHLLNGTINAPGSVTLRSADPRDTPTINFRFFDPNNPATEKHDLPAYVEAFNRIRKAFANVPAPAGPLRETLPCKNSKGCKDEDDKAYVKREAFSHHATSTARIGGDDDPMAVLDSRFRVRGVNRLRVVDASVFPRPPGAFPVAPVFIVGLKATDVILEDARKEGLKDQVGGEGRAPAWEKDEL